MKAPCFMIPSGRSASLLIGLILASIGSLAQNLFDEQHSREFARYLLTSRQYELAGMELERILFMDPADLQTQKDLVYAYRKSGSYPLALDKLGAWYADQPAGPDLAEEWVKLLLLSRSHEQAGAFLNQADSLTEDERLYYRMANYLLSGQWDAAAEMSRNDLPNGYSLPAHFSGILAKKASFRPKSPVLALGLSAVIPGMGKVYTTDWKDGLISLLFVATNAWQAYRGFSRDGAGSVYGWIFGSMAAGFYTSNLYGSWKSARDYNERFEHSLFHETESLVYGRF